MRRHEITEGYGKRYDPIYRAEKQHKADFKRREMEHELAHEEPNGSTYTRPADDGPYYIFINKKPWTKNGEPVEFKNSAHAIAVKRKLLDKHMDKEIYISSVLSDTSNVIPAKSSNGMYFYNVPSDKTNDADQLGLTQTKSGKWVLKAPYPDDPAFLKSKSDADSVFGNGKFWQPKTESVGETANGTTGQITKLIPGQSATVTSTSVDPATGTKTNVTKELDLKKGNALEKNPSTGEVTIKEPQAGATTQNTQLKQGDKVNLAPKPGNSAAVKVEDLKRLAGI